MNKVLKQSKEQSPPVAPIEQIVPGDLILLKEFIV